MTRFGVSMSRLRCAGAALLARVTVAACALLSCWSSAHAEITVSRLDLGLPNTAVFLISGEFNGNEILRFKSAIADVPPSVRVMAALHSPGGRLDQGFALGKFFYDARIATIVLAGHRCASSCSYAFFGGREATTGQPMRIMAAGARLGFHNFVSVALPDRAYTKDDLINHSRMAQGVINANLIYLKSVDAPIRSIVLNLETPNKEVKWLTESDALELGITVLNLESGRLVSPANLKQRTR